MRRIALAVVALAVVSSSAVAQEQSIAEVGMDGMLRYELHSPRSTSVTLPVSRIRAGFFVSPTFAIEPSASLSYSSGNSSSFSAATIGVAALYHFTATRSRPQPYVRPFLEYVHSSSSFQGQHFTGSSTAIGVGLGAKVPVSDRFAARFEGAYASQLGNSRLMAFAGLSFFTH